MASLSVEAAIKTCIERLGFSEVKKEQEEAMIKFVIERDVFLCLPTGFGKSLCYYSIPILFDILAGRSSPWSSVVVVSPLVALMKDQVASLYRKGLTAIEIVNEDNDNQTAVVRGDFQYIFTTPEILLTNKNWVNVFQSSSFQERLVGVIIDEAHCVQNWGIKFRKEYAKLGELRGFFPSRVCMMALTATASASSRKEIIKLLGMKKPHMIMRCPNKPNIIYYVEEKTQDIDIVFKPLVEVKVKGTRMDKVIIFCRTYNDCSAIYYYFKDLLKESITDPQGYPNVPKFRIVDMFSACNSPSVKNQILSSFSSATGRLRIVIATVAFGMGIDCPNIRRVIHWSPPSNCQSYIQETGRAGRDGMTAYATLFYSRKDVSLPFMESSIVKYCMNNNTCRRKVLFEDFDYKTDNSITGCKCCDLCAIVCQCYECLQFD